MSPKSTSRPQCPVCQAELNDDFGIVDCPSCKIPLSIQFDGSVESVSSAAPEEVDRTHVALIADDEATHLSFDPGVVVDATEDVPENSVESFEAEAISAETIDDEPAPDFSQGSFGAAEELGDAPEEDLPSEEVPLSPAYEDLESFEESKNEPAPTFVSAPANASPDLSDLSSFANSAESGAHGGALRYNVLVSGIDTADIRSDFRDLITDKKFVWDADSILKAIRGGSVRVDNLTAVKALLFIQRLRELPVEVQWEQHAIHQA
jgi:hypothetical protein